MTKKVITLLVSIITLMIFTSSLASATILCDSTKLTVTNTETSATFTCSNSDSQQVDVTTSGYFSINSNAIEGNSSKEFTINIASNAPTGYSPGLISIGYSYFIPVNVTTPSSQSQQQSGVCNINPSLVSYTQSIQQGTQVLLPKITFNPINCPDSLILTASSVIVQGGIITASGQKPISINSVVSDGVILSVDTTGLLSQTYTSYLTINAFSKTFTIPLTIIVTTGTSPANNFSLSSLPTCSLTSTQLAINSTYSMVCTNLQPDVTVVPRIDNSFIEGTGVDKTSSQFVWYFKPKRYGNTNISGEFYYQNSPVGTPYSQEVKISSSGLSIAGTNLEVIFTPSLDVANPNQDIIAQVIDNKTNSIVADSQIYIDAIALNKSDDTFHLTMQLDKNYSMRARANGYNDLTETIKLNSQPIFINITPSSGDSNTAFNITTSVQNATLMIDDVIVSNPFLATLTSGQHVITAVKEGYYNSNVTLNVDLALISSLSTLFEKGTPQIASLSKNTSWTLYYQKDESAVKTQLSSGNGSQVYFTPDKTGIYSLQSGDNVLGSWKTNGWSGKILGISWWYIALFVLLIIFIFWAIGRKKEDSGELMFGGGVNAPS